MGATPGYNKERKDKIVKKTGICGHCGFHKGENAERKPKSDKHKEHRHGIQTR